ncbi:uncharacterized protein LOC112603004, partial [Melanaphis sacchari]|uniref:uncharacterized protein LOC112603004 n=1 Tax=Melanaphis sacchari TaxID=742174 RepID=UPI000DC12EF7
MVTKTKMIPKNEDNLMINTRIMKITGLYYLLDSRSPKIFGHNVFKCMSIVQMSIMSATLVAGIVNIIKFFLDDINSIMLFLMLMTSGTLSVVKLYSTVVNSDTIWNCIQMTSVDDLSYKYHNRRILKDGQLKSKSYNILIMFMWLNLTIFWGISPLFITNAFLEIKIKNKIGRYRFNILNVIFPDSDQFFNDNFIIYYCIEFIVLIQWGHSAMNFDILLLSTNITFKYQLKTIANSFSTFNITHNDVKNDCTKIVKHQKESELMFNFKSIIYDQQSVI